MKLSENAKLIFTSIGVIFGVSMIILISVELASKLLMIIFKL